MTETATSKNGLPIRLTDERWVHITEEHAELAGYRVDVLDAIADPQRIVAGTEGELLAIRLQPDGKILVVVTVSSQTTALSSQHSSLDARHH